MNAANHFSFKVIVAGPFASGKTTFVAAITDEVIGTEAQTSGDEASVKATTTVGMEYGTLPIDGGDFTAELGVYGVPGQERFEFMWSIVADGMDGLLLLVDASRPETWSNSLHVGEYFRALNPTPVLIGVNRGDHSAELLDDIRRAVPIPDAIYRHVDVPDRTAARSALVVLLSAVLDSIEDGETADATWEGDGARNGAGVGIEASP